MRFKIPITLIHPETKEDVPMWAIIDGNGLTHVPRELNEDEEHPSDE